MFNYCISRRKPSPLRNTHAELRALPYFGSPNNTKMKKNTLSIIFIFLTILCIGQVTFTTLTTPVAQQLLGISFLDSLNGYACGKAGTIIKTTDGGQSWTTLATNTTEDLSDIKVMPASQGQKVIAVGDNNTIIKSVDGGANWFAQTIPFQAGSFVFGVQCLDTLNYFACGGDYSTFSGSVLKTTDGGASWTKTAVAGSIFLDKIHMRSMTFGFTAGTNTTFSNGSIHKTINGTSWPGVKTSTDLLTNVWCSSNTHIVSVGLAGQIWRSTNAGAVWTNQAFNSTDLFGLQFVDSLIGFACGGTTTSNIILSTNDGGLTWSQIPHALNGSFQSISTAGNVIFMAGDQGTVIKGTLPSPPVTTAISKNTAPFSIEVYPCPSSEKIHINLSGIQNGRFTLEDPSGKVVKTIDIDNHCPEIDISDLPAGTYFYNVSCRAGNSRGKCIILN